MNLFLTEDGVLKLGYYGLATQAECYSIKGTYCDGVRSFAYEVFKGEYGMKSDLWSLGIALIEMMGLTPYHDYDNNDLPTMSVVFVLPFDMDDIESSELADFLENCFETEVDEEGSVNEMMNVSGM